jgi:hypothetical protein
MASWPFTPLSNSPGALSSYESFAGGPGQFMARLQHDATVLDGEPRWAALDYDKHSIP